MVKSMLAQEGSGFFGAFYMGAPLQHVSLADALDPTANHDDIPREIIDMALALR
jgi:hypothetical protein